MVIVLALANCVSFIDRLILSLLVGPIKAELHLTDTEIGLLQGAAFAIFYCMAGLPLARLADRANRKWIVTSGITCGLHDGCRGPREATDSYSSIASAWAWAKRRSPLRRIR